MKNTLNYKIARKMDPCGIILHSTGFNNPYLKRYVQTENKSSSLFNLLGNNKYKNDWNSIKTAAIPHIIVGKFENENIGSIQLLPWTYQSKKSGVGRKGSCDNGWIQIELCEDNLKDEKYFQEVYSEMIKNIVFLCKKFNLNPIGKTKNNIPILLCHAEAHSLGYATNHGDILHWLKNFNKTMEDIRQDVFNNLNSNKSEKEESSMEENNQCEFKINDEIRIIPGSTYASGAKMPTYLYQRKIYVRQIRSNGDLVVGLNKVGPLVGTIKATSAIPFGETLVQKGFTPYLVIINADELSVKTKPDSNSKETSKLKRNGVYTIIGEQDGWGRLKNGKGWILLQHTKKLVKKNG